MYQKEVQIRVRYAETDQMGYVYYGNYAMYYEVARVEAFRSLGFPYKSLEDMGIGMPVLSMNIRYHQPAKYDDHLTVKVTIPDKPRARIKFIYEVTNEGGRLIKYWRDRTGLYKHGYWSPHQNARGDGEAPRTTFCVRTRERLHRHLLYTSWVPEARQDS